MCRYTPQQIELEYRLKPFIPEFIPAIGDLDAFLKVERPELPPPGSSAPFGPPILQSIRETQAKGAKFEIGFQVMEYCTPVVLCSSLETLIK